MDGLPGERRGEKPPQETFPLVEIQAAIHAVRYGEVRIVIQDGWIVQIDRTEKVRLDSLKTRGSQDPVKA